MVVKDGRFLEVGSTQIVDNPAYKTYPRFRYPQMALVPGFVDCHNHPDSAFAKAITCGEPAQIWKRIWVPLSAAMNADDAYVAALWTAQELLRGGITTVVFAGVPVGDKATAAMRALVDVGIRSVFALAFSDRAEFDTPASVDRHRPTTSQCIDAAATALRTATGSSRITLSLACPGIQSASPDLIRAVSSMCAEEGILFQIHANEHTPEVEYCLDRHGKRPIELLADIGALGPHVLLAHATLVTPREVRLLADTGAAVSYNPVASSWKGNAIAPALEFAAHGVRFGLGTDSTRNDGFRLLEAAEVAQRLGRGMSVIDFSSGGGATWVHAITSGGADAAGLGNKVGAITVGSHADFLLLNRNRLECQPSWDFPWELVRFYDRTNLEAVYIDGTLLLEQGQLLSFSEEEFLANNLKRAHAAVLNAPVVRVHGPSRQSQA